MAQYLVAIHHPDDYDPPVVEDEAMSRDIDALNDEMKAADVRVFVGGLLGVETVALNTGKHLYGSELFPRE